MILYYNENHDGVWLITYKEKCLEAGYKESLRSFNECKIVRILEGKGIWKVAGRTIPFQKDDIFLFAPQDLRQLESVQQRLRIEQINFLPYSLGSYGRCCDIFFNRPEDFQHRIADKTVQNHLCSCFESLRHYATEETPLKDEFIRNTLTRMVLEVASIYALQESRDNHDDIVAKAMQYAGAHPEQDLSLGAVAKKFGISAPYFSARFRRETGQSFHDYVATLRINKVIVAVADGKENILDAALRFGFRSSSGFYKTFRRVTGNRPGAFKE